MHRAAKWKAEKSKLQVVFKLHLEATQVPQPGWEKLFVSLTSFETGKSIAKTARASVRDGSCKWDEPLYETTRLLQDTKTRKFDEKWYKLAVSMGSTSSRHGLLGEACINLADYAEVADASTVSFPLQRCNYDTILHVTVHTLNEKTGFREFEQQNLTERGARKSENRDDEPDGNALASEGKIDGRGVKEKRRSTSTVHLRPNNPQVSSIQPNSASNGNHRGWITGDAISSHPDKKQSVKEKVHEVPEIGGITNGANQDVARFRSQISKHPPKSHNSSGQVHACLRQIERSSSECTHGWSSDYSTENDAANVYEENEKLRENVQTAESSIMQLKTEVASLEKRAEGQAAKIETLMRQLSTEKKQGQDPTDKILDLKSEGDCIKLDLEKCDSLRKGEEGHKCVSNGWLDIGDTNQANGFGRSGLELQIFEAEQQVHVLSVSNHQLETRIQTLEEEKLVLQKHLNMFLKKEQNRQLGDGVTVTEKQCQLGTERSLYAESGEEDTYSKMFNLQVHDTQLDSQQHSMGKGKTLLATAEVSEEFGRSKTNSHSTPEQVKKLCELSPEADDYKRACNSITNKTEQLEYEYKTLLHDLEARISYFEESEKQLQEQVENVRNEHAAVLYRNSTLELQAQKLNQELGQQAASYAVDRNEMALLKVELEQKANRAELVLKRTQQSNAKTVQQLHKELERLSLLISSTFDANEKLSTQAFAEAAQFCAEKNELEDQLKIMHKSLQKANEEITVTRQQCEAKLQELRTQMELSKKSEDELLSKLLNTSNELESQIKSEKEYIIRDKELSARILILEEEVQELLNAKSIFIQKAEEYHIVKADLETIRISLEGCKIERMGLESSLQSVNQEKSKLEKELSSLKEILRNSDAEVDELKYCNDELQKKVAQLQSTLEDQIEEQELKTEEMKHLILSQKELKLTAEAEASQLRAQRNDLEEYSACLQESLENTQSEIAFIKEQYEVEVQELVAQLDMSNKQREELFSRLQNAWNDSENCMNNEMSHIKINEELSSKLSMLETELQAALKDKSILTQRLKECDSMMSEFENTRLTLDDTKAKNDELKSVLEKVKLESELNNEVILLKEALKNADRELDELRFSRNELEITVAFLKSKLDDPYAELSSSNKQQDEVIELERQHSELKHTFSDKELELEDLRKHLVHWKELLQKADVETSQLNERIIELEKQLSVSQESLQMANVENASVRKQFEVKVQDLDLFRSKAEVLSLDLQNTMRKLEIQTTNESDFHRINEDLCFKISALEAEVETALNEKRELLLKVEEYDTARTELESSKRSLDILSNQQMSELIELRRRHSELKHRFSEQELKTEDLRKHVVHSEERLQNADLEVSQLNERKSDLEKKLSVMQELLEMANVENDSMTEQLEGKVQELVLLADSLDRVKEEKGKLDKEIVLLKEMLKNSGTELDELKNHRDKLVTTVAFLQNKVDEQNDELMQLQSEYTELKDHISEQEVKTEELRRYSIHLEELKQNAEEEAAQLRVEKKELEEHSMIIQESLRIAFIREQFEAKEQEFLNQLHMSKRDGEELLSKLQETSKELDILKSSETHYMKRTEELSVRLNSLEMEFQSVLKEKNDLVQKVKECNEVKAEFEGTRTTLDICKAEKEQLEYLLQRADLGKEQLNNELCSLKEMLRYSDVELDELKCCKDELELKIASLQSKLDSQNALMPLHEDEKGELMRLRKDEAELKAKLLEQESKAKDMERNIYQLENELQQKVDALVIVERKLKNLEDNIKATSDDNPDELKSKVIAPETSRQGISANEKKLQNDIDKVNLTDAHLNEETLTSSMDRIHEELEKMKHDNLAPFQQENDLCELHPQEPFQKEMEQLQMVNKQLENMFPSFKEPLKSGNVIDRVLALERELADALKTNETKKRQFQSSFVKQQADQAAMLQSFRDINDLINDMLELKKRNSLLEDELKDLQSRYSQVSLKFAEVEGERQQLVMTVKNLRVGKK